jgi:hypothetical protein
MNKKLPQINNQRQTTQRAKMHIQRTSTTGQERKTVSLKPIKTFKKKKKMFKAGCRWLIPVILATCEAEIRRTMV